jgi:hypothetical protein
MGVQVYLLEPRMVTLLIDGLAQEIGTLRRSWKVTEIDSERATEIDAAKASLQGQAAPVAAMLADVIDMPTAAKSSHRVAAHLVLGWDADRSSVTDFGWDFLPVLGYAVRCDGSAGYLLHEEMEGGLSPITRARAIELGIHNTAAQFVRRGQPSIVKCLFVRRYISAYVQADCVLSDGRAAEILTTIATEGFPQPAWYVGKRPSDAAHYTKTDGGE